MPKVWIDSQGRVQIPRRIRELLGIKEKRYITYDVRNNELILRSKEVDKK